MTTVPEPDAWSLWFGLECDHEQAVLIYEQIVDGFMDVDPPVMTVGAMRRLTDDDEEKIIVDLTGQVKELEAELREVASCVEFEDPRLSYVSVQMDRDVWLKWMAAILTRPEVDDA